MARFFINHVAYHLPVDVVHGRDLFAEARS